MAGNPLAAGKPAQLRLLYLTEIDEADELEQVTTQIPTTVCLRYSAPFVLESSFFSRGEKCRDVGTADLCTCCCCTKFWSTSFAKPMEL